MGGGCSWWLFVVGGGLVAGRQVGRPVGRQVGRPRGVGAGHTGSLGSGGVAATAVVSDG